MVNLTPVIIMMSLFLVAYVAIPKIIRKPTGIQPIDDIVKMTIAQRGFLMSGVILAGLLMLATEYIQMEVLKGEKLF